MGTRVNALLLIVLRHLALPANDNDMINLQWVPAVSPTPSKHVPYHFNPPSIWQADVVAVGHL